MSTWDDPPVQLSAGLGALEKPLPRACESCRFRKIRCQQSFASTPGVCQPCAQSGRSCIVTVPTKKRRRKRTDARVTELEKQVTAMTAALHQSNGASLPPESGHRQQNMGNGSDPMLVSISSNQASPFSNLPVYSESSNISHEDTWNQSRNSPTLVTHSEVLPPPRALANHPLDDCVLSGSGDAIDRQLLSIEEASRLFIRYKHELVSHLPVVVLPEDIKLSDMRLKKPVLLLSILAAAATTSHPTLNLRLNQEIQQTYADRVAMNSERSIELIQSILVTVSWYCPPDQFDKLKFYQYLHMAWCMVMELGLDKNSPSSSIKGPDRSRPSVSTVGTDPLDERRALLSCYFMCSQASIAHHRRSAAHFSTRIEESLTLLVSSPYAASTDLQLCALVRVQHIMEQSVSACALGESVNICNFAEPRMQSLVKSFHQQLQNWRATLPTGLMNGFMMIQYHSNVIHLYEMAMYVDHDPGEFVPPFIIKRALQDSSRNILSLAYIDAVLTIQSCQALLVAVLEMNFESLCALPTPGNVRMIYALVVLTKLSLSATSAESPLRDLLDVKAIAAATYQSQILTHYTHAVEYCSNRTLAKFAVIVFKLRSWFIQHDSSIESTDDYEAEIEPCVFLRPEDSLSQDLAPPQELDPSRRTPDYSREREIRGSLPSWTPMAPTDDHVGLTTNLLPHMEYLEDWVPDVDIRGLLDLGDNLNFDLDLGINQVH